jgi:hypothetical protein
MLCHYVEYHYAECHVLFIVMLSVIMLDFVMLSVVMLSVVMLSIVMLSVVMLRVVMLSVKAPFQPLCHICKQGWSLPLCSSTLSVGGLLTFLPKLKILAYGSR